MVMSNETNPTSVEWIYVELYKFLNGKSEFQDANDILNKAKEMHKKELDLAYQDGKEIEHIQNTIEKNKKTTEITNEQRNNYKE
jgi:hypothetical protein